MKSTAVFDLVHEAIATLVRHREEQRALWRRFLQLGEIDLARGLLLIPGKALTEELEIVRDTLQAESERRARLVDDAQEVSAVPDGLGSPE